MVVAVEVVLALVGRRGVGAVAAAAAIALGLVPGRRSWSRNGRRSERPRHWQADDLNGISKLISSSVLDFTSQRVTVCFRVAAMVTAGYLMFQNPEGFGLSHFPNSAEPLDEVVIEFRDVFNFGGSTVVLPPTRRTCTGSSRKFRTARTLHPPVPNS